ncbi:hypothetical protein [Actinopolymorpha singaporensis]|uniref:Carbohydrate binding domain-containing protein n=1 Tax=Actinopolymorpha singaporensis TaxID=117157 RepID=A0A1H1TQA9_9ACTN|nr:hypothetical protein [Actinopolymorpha singaporensis]SDS62473.1 hypothetical protein SAMN04489717_3297 [Actinopolymorpha singaporensis]
MPAVVSAAGPAGELGPNVFGADSLGVAEQLPVDDDEFEQTPSAWERVVEAPASVEIRVGAGRNGGGGAVIIVPEQAPVAWPNVGQRLAASAVRTLLRMSAWVRTREAADGYGAYLAIDYLDAAGKRITWSQSGSLWSTHDWVRIEMLGEVPPDTTTIAIRLLLDGHGEAAFDDVSLEACMRSHPAP